MLDPDSIQAKALKRPRRVVRILGLSLVLLGLVVLTLIFLVASGFWSLWSLVMLSIVLFGLGGFLWSVGSARPVGKAAYRAGGGVAFCIGVVMTFLGFVESGPPLLAPGLVLAFVGIVLLGRARSIEGQRDDD